MRIAIVCPHYPPDHCGVGDYTHQLAAALYNLRHDVKVWTAQSNPVASMGIEVGTVSGRWSRSKLFSMAEHISLWRPDHIVIQYTPSLYAARGFGIYLGSNLALAPWIRALRQKTKATISLTVHELNHPVEVNLHGIVFGIPQFIQVRALVLLSNLAFFTYRTAKERCARILPNFISSKMSDRLNVLPIGANIPVVKATAFETIDKLRTKTILLYFGGVHPGNLFNLIFPAVSTAANTLGKDRVAFVAVGVTQDQLETLLTKHRHEDLKSISHALGYLSAEQVSYCLQHASIVLAPFADGISTRRGSAMAAFSHGCAVVTTAAEATDTTIPWDTFCRMSQPDDLSGYITNVIELLGSNSKAKELGDSAAKYYTKHFDWSVIASQLSETLIRHSKQ